MKYLLTLVLFSSLFGIAKAQTEGSDSIDMILSRFSGQEIKAPVNKILMPRVFNGYRHISRHPRKVKFMDKSIMKEIFEDVLTADSSNMASLETDSAAKFNYSPPIGRPTREELSVAFGKVMPENMARTISSYRWQEDFIYNYMMNNPWSIQYAYWDLPERPSLPEEDVTFLGYLKRVKTPEVKSDEDVTVNDNIKQTNWLHTFNTALQLSQAYVSGNWYQGGTSYLAFFGNVLWDVMLNQVYYPKVIFQSTVSYKLALNSSPEDKYHKYQISEDLFQYNLKAGYKAVNNWYYSFMTQFKTQFLNNYPADSQVRSAAFLSPGELNVGIGMTYSKENANKTLKFSATISPLSYNLKTCIDKYVDPEQFGISKGHKTLSEIGSNVEVNFVAKFWKSATYTTRFFFFTDYHSISTDWENTVNFQFTKLFSTQVYAHLRYDTKSDPSISPKWGKLMLKEILSIGLSYNFSTK